MSTSPSLSALLGPHFPASVGDWGRWSWLAGELKITRASVAGWLKSGIIPARRVEAVADLLGVPDEVRAELRRRAGFQVIESTAGGSHAHPLP